MELDSRRRYRFAVDPDELWSAIAQTDRYRHWWPWLRTFDARGLVAGDSWRCTIRAPLPYTMRFHVRLVEVEGPRLVEAELDGDVTGTARLVVGAEDRGCAVVVMSRLTPSRRPLSLFASVARPLVRRGHDRVLDAGARQFASRALAP